MVAPRRDAGWTMTEIVVAIALMGSIIVAIIGGMFAVVRASAANDEASKVQAVLGSAADRIANYKYLECPEDADAYPDYNAVSYARVGKAAVESVGWDESTVQITNYEFWNPDTNSWQASNSLQGAGCNASVGLTTSKTMQKITVVVTSPSGNTTSSLDIVKSDIRPKEVRDVSTP
jgi:type II secretory pathway pseudopilin PulG